VRLEFMAEPVRVENMVEDGLVRIWSRRKKHFSLNHGENENCQDQVPLFTLAILL
jgi:hypothetical protein